MKKALSLVLSIIMLLSCVAGLDFSAYAYEISGNYEYYVLDDNTLAIHKYLGNEKNVVIPSAIDGKVVTVLGYDAFQMKVNLETIVVPKTVRELGTMCFAYDSDLKEVTILGDPACDSTHIFYYCVNVNIKCLYGSKIHQYALDNNLSFDLLDKDMPNYYNDLDSIYFRYSGSNFEDQDYDSTCISNTHGTIKSHLVKLDNGYMRFQAMDLYTQYAKIFVEYFDDSFSYQRKVELENELPIFGGFYEMNGYYFILSGDANQKENDSKEVIRITKFTKDWKRIDSCSIYGGELIFPFKAGTARFDSHGDTMVIRTCKQMYKSSDGINHQKNMTIIVDTAKMRVTNYGDICGWVSHSYNQFVKKDSDNSFVFVEHGDGSPRAIALFKYNNSLTKVLDYKSYMQFPGSDGDNYTGASIGGFEISKNKYIIAGNYEIEEEHDPYNTRNIFVLAIDKNDTSKYTKKFITNYKSGDKNDYNRKNNISTPVLVKVSDNRFLLMWYVNNDSIFFTFLNGGKVNYCMLDNNGDVISDICSFDGQLSDCPPIVVDNNVIWYAYNGDDLKFYQISINDLSNYSIIDKSFCHDYSFKMLYDGTLALIGSNCDDDISINNEFFEKKVSIIKKSAFNSNKNIKSLSSSVDIIDESAFYHCDNLQTVELNKGTKEIGKEAFGYCKSLKTVTIAEGVEKIGKYAFYNCSSLETVFVPSTLKNVDALAFYNCPNVVIVGPLSVKDMFRYYKFMSVDCFNGTHDTYLVNEKNATCKSTGYSGDKYCKNCNQLVENGHQTDKLPHNERVYNKSTATCSSDGYTGDTYCYNCGVLLSTGETIKKLPHDIEVKNAYASSCYYQGYTGDKYCKICDEIIEYGKSIGYVEHSYTKSVVDPTCTTNGYTEFVCDNCGYSYKGNITNKASHVYRSEIVEPNCTAQGYTTNTCTVCGDTFNDSFVDALGHTEFVDKGTPATCTSTGLTDGKHCSVCKTVLVQRKTIGKISHTVVVDKAIPATYASAGKTEGSHCSVCKAVIRQQTAIAKLKVPTATISKLTATKKGFKAQWKKNTKVTGYQIRYSTNSNMSKAKTVTISKNSTTNKSVSKLSAKRKYYVQIRTYKTVSGKKYYSSWSKSKAVTTKK